MHVHELVPLELIDTTVSDDLSGPARLEIAAQDAGSNARLQWEVELRDPLLRVAARVARPIMEWGTTGLSRLGYVSSATGRSAGTTHSESDVASPRALDAEFAEIAT